MKTKGQTFTSEIEVETINFRPKVGQYGLYNDGKIWRAVASSGAGKNYKITFVRELSNEKMTLRGHTQELRQMKLITKPKGHISI